MDIPDEQVFLSKAAIVQLVDARVQASVSGGHTHRMHIGMRTGLCLLLGYAIVLQSWILTDRHTAVTQTAQDAVQTYIAQVEAQKTQVMTILDGALSTFHQQAQELLQRYDKKLQTIQWVYDTPQAQQMAEVVERLERVEQR